MSVHISCMSVVMFDTTVKKTNIVCPVSYRDE